jgi:hypothetical protein
MHRRSLLRYFLLPFLLWVGQRVPSFLLGVVFAKGQRREVEYFSNLILPSSFLRWSLARCWRRREVAGGLRTP